MYVMLYLYFFFFKQKTAYEMRISDWSSDVCSSDLWTQPLQVDDGPVLVGDLVLEATVQDDRGRSIATESRIPYFGRDRYVGINYSGWAKAGTANDVETLVVGRDGKPRAGVPYYVKIERKLNKGASVKGAGNAQLTPHGPQRTEERRVGKKGGS